MKHYVASLLCLMFVACALPGDTPQAISREYISGWIDFYPSRALGAGRSDSAFAFESLTIERIDSWIQFNRSVLERLGKLPEGPPPDDAADVELLRRQILLELERWETDRISENSPLLYAGAISQSLTHILARPELDADSKIRAIRIRLSGIRDLCAQAESRLRNGRPHDIARSKGILQASARYLGTALPEILAEWAPEAEQSELKSACGSTAQSIRSLGTFIKNELEAEATLTDSLGRDHYARRLAIYTGRDLAPENLADLAYREITTSRKLMGELSTEYWSERSPEKAAASEEDELVRLAIEEMEANRETRQAGFLRVFEELIDRAEEFVREKQIATLPEKRTLVMALSPAHFAGAAVGGVYSAGPFNPDAQTLFYLPTVPDEAPEDVKEGFYRSFNNHFNTMIITHEIFPGHYHQAKTAAGHVRQVRALFSDGLYVEGWGTISEVITLDAGWNGHDPLDRLAHLRKRLENATRAYTSVMVHCQGWDRERVAGFAREEGLLAPQFALNLWDRVLASPFQITSYFLGFHQFSDLLNQEKERLGDRFSMLRFCDAVLKAGAVPIGHLPALIQD
jgi:uncharacterized protein (DUF885 family)